ncbi:MAG: phage Gp37/Gp68 family protein [Polyangiaceae bacterium]|nr:phage Gp37/Gp68 family protein [Polyangiaceae bacterium]
MGTNSSIEWTHHTFNMWWGCTRVSPACDHCYAEAQAHHRLPLNWLIIGEGRAEPRRTRFTDPKRPEIWGADAPRAFPPAHSAILKSPYKWNREAEAAGQPARVFVESMGDLFDKHRLDEVNRMMDVARARLFDEFVPKCAWLNFQFLSKRPHSIKQMVPKKWLSSWPANAWVGATVEDQQRAAQRLPHLVEIPAPVRFVSVEPLLGPLDLSPWLDKLDWVIVGGESGTQARPAEIDWVRRLRDQVTEAGIWFFFKQWGNWAQRDGASDKLVKLATKNFRVLDGREWSEFPTPRAR